MNLYQAFADWFNYNIFVSDKSISVDELIADFNAYIGTKISKNEMLDMLDKYDVTVIEEVAYGIKLWY